MLRCVVVNPPATVQILEGLQRATGPHSREEGGGVLKMRCSSFLILGIALGTLQLLTLEIGKIPLDLGGCRWMRTTPQSGFPSERMLLWSLVNELDRVKESREKFMLTGILEG